jgi:hypothetical protein
MSIKQLSVNQFLLVLFLFAAYNDFFGLHKNSYSGVSQGSNTDIGAGVSLALMSLCTIAVFERNTKFLSFLERDTVWC